MASTFTITTGNSETSVGQRLTEVSPKPTKIFRQKLANFYQQEDADKN
jgi:hypothetical protein